MASAAAAPEGLDDHSLDAVVVHLRQDIEGIRQLRFLRRARPDAHAVCVLPKPAWKPVRSLLREGATAVVAEEEFESSLVPAIRGALIGQLTLPIQLRRDIAQPVLSTREKQMLAMVVMGFSNPEISEKLFVTESTVKSHLSSAFAKLGVRSRNEAAALILDPARGFGMGILEISGEQHIVATVGERAVAPAA